MKIERAKLGPCPVCGREVIENRKGYSCWSRDDPGCGFVIWKKKAGKNLPVAVAKELMASLKASIERGDEPPIGRTEKQVHRLPRPLRAHLPRQAARSSRATTTGKWHVEFDEEWAEGRARSPHEDGAEEGETKRRGPRRAASAVRSSRTLRPSPAAPHRQVGDPRPGQ